MKILRIRSISLKKVSLFLVVLLSIGLALGFGTVPAVEAATFNIADGDLAGLIIAIETANTNGEANIINLAPNGLYSSTSAFGAYETMLPVIKSNLTINGNGATIQRSALAGNFGILYVERPADLKINNLTIDNALSLRIDGGGGINNYANVTLTNCTFSNNQALGGGAIASYGTTIINNCTFLNNTSYGSGGAIENVGSASAAFSPSTVTITNSTFYGNHSFTPSAAGGTILNATSMGADNGATLVVTNSTISGNIADGGAITGGIYNATTVKTTATIRNTIITNNTGGNCYGTFNTGTNNLEFPGSVTCGAGTSLALTDLLSSAGPANNGGPTRTIALAAAPNPAIDGGNANYCPPADQRGFPRIYNCDIGAYEAIPAPTLSKIFNPGNIVTAGISSLTFSLSNSNPITLHNVSFSDTMPSQITIANSPNIINNCSNGTVTAIAGTSSISVNNLLLNPNQTCTITVNVTSATSGNWSNTTGPISAIETMAGVNSNTAILHVLNSLVVTNTLDAATSPPVGSLRQVVGIAAAQNGAIITFDPNLGTNPQITLVASLVIPHNILIEANCNNKVRLTSNFTNAVQLQGHNLLRGLKIYTSVGVALKINGQGSSLECTQVSHQPIP